MSPGPGDHSVGSVTCAHSIRSKRLGVFGSTCSGDRMSADCHRSLSPEQWPPVARWTTPQEAAVGFRSALRPGRSTVPWSMPQRTSRSRPWPSESWDRIFWFVRFWSARGSSVLCRWVPTRVIPVQPLGRIGAPICSRSEPSGRPHRPSPPWKTAQRRHHGADSI